MTDNRNLKISDATKEEPIVQSTKATSSVIDAQLMPSPIVSKTSDSSDVQLNPSPNALSLSSGKNSDTGPSSSTTPSSGTVTSIDTVPNSSPELLLSDSKCSGEKTQFWGNMYAMKEEFYNLDMEKDRYTFGRKSDCDYSFDIPSIRKHKYFSHYSKKQFAINRSVNSDGSTIVFLEDLGGTNGTFVNGERVPSKSQRTLKSQDKIALCYDTNEIFLYITPQNEPDYDKEFSEKYVLEKRIGAGACGEVYKVLLKHGYGHFACKIIKQSSISPGASSGDIRGEVRILKQLNHPGIIGVHDVIDTIDRLYLVLEYAPGGDLFNRVKKGALPEPIAKLYFFQMLNAVMYLHDHGITHRDLKPENILLMSHEEPCRLKITDFGISRLASEKTLMHTLAGTLSYWSPEIVHQLSSQTFSGYTKLVDMWSLGIILFICLAAYPPFAPDRSDTTDSLKDQILTANFNFQPEQWKKVSSLAKDLISHLIKVDVRERFNSNQAMNHVWLKDSDMLARVADLVEVKEEVLELLGSRSISSCSTDTRKVSRDELVCKSSNGSAPLSGFSETASRSISSSSGENGSIVTVIPLKRATEGTSSEEPSAKFTRHN